jgi:hypothetical protein
VTALAAARHETALAQSGIQHVRTAGEALKAIQQGSLDAAHAARAESEFTAAYNDFSQLQQDMGRIPGGTFVPILGGKLDSAARLLPLAIDASRAGMLGSDALGVLVTGLSDPLNSKSPGITQKDLTAIGADLAQITALFNADVTRLNQLQPSDLQLDPRLAPALAQFRTALPALRQALADAQAAIQLAPALIGVGKPSNYLVELLDSTELRPGGGFIGNYGILTLSGGRLDSLHVTDVDLLDRPFEFAGNVIPYPDAYKWFTTAPAWSLRDSNLDADFPTSARNGEQTYHIEGGNVDVQGVIAVTPWVIQQALGITGPITLPEFGETVTAKNLVDRIHFHQLGPGHGSEYIPDPASLSSQRKKFTAILFQHFLDRVKQLMSTKRPQFVKLLMNAVHAKDVQIYLNAEAGENILRHNHIASTIDAPAGDGLFVVDANVIGSKSNNFIKNTLKDNVTIDATGNAVHQATLTYSWPNTPESANNNYGNKSLYVDYIRVYIPPKSVVKSQSGWEPHGTSTAFGRQVVAGKLYLDFGATATIQLTWTVPAAATKDASGWHYKELLQRPAGVTWATDLQFALPACARTGTTPAGLKAAGARVYKSQVALTADTTFSIDYGCS